MSLDSFISRRENAEDQQALEQRRLNLCECPKCGSENWNQRTYRAPGVGPDDHTCRWMECDDCGYKLDPA